MENKKVWKILHKMDVPNDRRLIGCKWIFKIKRDGRYSARLVALGYSQVPGVDFTDNFAPMVMCDIQSCIGKNDYGRPKMDVNGC